MDKKWRAGEFVPNGQDINGQDIKDMVISTPIISNSNTIPSFDSASTDWEITPMVFPLMKMEKDGETIELNFEEFKKLKELLAKMYPELYI